jgi:hypothetical protein
MALVLPINNFPLTAEYNSAVRFKSATERTLFIQQYNSVYSQTGGSSYISLNFSWNDGVNTKVSVPIKATSTQTESELVHKYLSANYLHVIDDSLSGTTNWKQFFYFITSSRMISAEVLEFTLVLDVFTTYIQDITITEPLLTERKHCNRFIKTTTNQFRFRKDDVLLGDELDSQFKAMIPSGVETLNYEYFKSTSNITNTTENSNLRDFVNNQISSTMWMYVFFMPGEGATQDDGTTLYDQQLETGGRPLDIGVKIAFAPVKAMRVRNATLDSQFVWSAWLLYNYVRNTSLNSFVISIRFSPIAPFSNWMAQGSLGIQGSSASSPYFDRFTSDILRLNIVASNWNDDVRVGSILDGDSLDRWLVITGSSGSDWLNGASGRTVGLESYAPTQERQPDQKHLLETFLATLDLPSYSESGFGPIAISTAPKNKLLEPKLFTIPYKRYEMMTAYSQPRDLNELHFAKDLGSSNMPYELKFECLDVPTASEQKFNYGVSKTLNNFYFKDDYLYNMTLAGQNVYEFPIAKDQFINYVSNHSNFLISGLALPMVSSGINALATKNPMSLVSGVSDAINFGISMDDLQRAPDTLQATGNNFIHDYSTTRPLGIRLAKYKLLDEQQDQVFDYFYRYGYRINRDTFWTQSSSSEWKDSLFNRSRFNYIKLMDDDFVRKIICSRDMSIKAKQEMAIALKKGIKIVEASSSSGATTVVNFNEAKENPEYFIGNN